MHTKNNLSKDSYRKCDITSSTNNMFGGFGSREMFGISLFTASNVAACYNFLC